MQTPKKLSPIAIRLEPELKAALEEFAAADDRTLSGYIHRVLKRHVEREQAKFMPKGKK